MFKKYNNDWERTQHYLIKSLFQDISLLSTVQEEAVSNSSSPSNYDRLKTCSPLPELIIEVERKRNPHDEPEEYYVDLERRMRKYYRKVIKNKEHKFENYPSASLSKSSASFRSTEFEDIKSCSSTSLDKHETSVETMATDSSTQKEKLEVSENELLDENSIQVYTTSSESTSVDNDNRIEIKVEMHTESNKYSDDVKRITTPEDAVKDKNSSSSNHSNREESEEDIMSFLKDYELIGNTELARKKSNTVREEEIEVMRRGHIISSSRGSIQNYVNIAELLNKSFTASDSIGSPSKSIEQILGTSTMKTDMADPSFHDFKVSSERCSTPRIPINNSSVSLNIMSENENDSKENKTSSEHSASFETIHSDSENFVSSSARTTSFNSKITQSEINTTSTSSGDSVTETPNVTKEKEKDCEIQTPVEQVIDWEILKHNFFVGTPQIYNICYCKNHKCED